MFSSLSVSVRLARDVDFTKEVFRDDYNGVFASLVSRYVTTNQSVANNTTEVVPLADVITGQALYVKTNRQIKILLSYNGTDEQEIVVGKDAATGGVALLTCLFDALEIQNESGQAAEVFVFLGGV
jgi:hypothetical protein